ncbi:MAG: TrmH family RNA methyltransferase, partial [Planctomycetes bacterium]|nr:TrmH family RNA methyltransferase [Planctomycetota bacterium]
MRKKKPRSSRKRRLDAHRHDALARAEVPKPDLVLVLDRIRSMHNVGSIFRTADGFGVRELVLGGFTPAPPRPEISKTALGADEVVPFRCVADPKVAVLQLRAAGATVVALEQTHDSRSIYEFEFPTPLALVLGHETEGVDDELLDFVDAAVEIPMLGS